MKTRKAIYTSEEQMMVDMSESILETHKSGIEATLAKAVIRMMASNLNKRQQAFDDLSDSTWPR